MGKFKVGDVVQRKAHRSDITKYLGLGNNGVYTVTAVSSTGYWIQLNGWDDGGKDLFPWYSYNFVLAESDELPPAPESVSYLKDEGQHKLTASMYPQSVSIKIHLEYPGTVKCLSYAMEPDAALQLAHDLRRMAMEIKRKEKQV